MTDRMAKTFGDPFIAIILMGIRFTAATISLVQKFGQATCN
jgi:hypothetical protein